VDKHFPQFRNYREYAGGGLADMGAHHFDIAQWALEMDESGAVKIEPPTESEKTGLKFTYANGVEMFYGGPSGCTFKGELGTIYVDHGRHWLDAIRSRQRPICDVEIGHRSAAVCHFANLGYQLRRPLIWDPAVERFWGDDEANALLNREPRDPWMV
jgi:hypothetical protein